MGYREDRAFFQELEAGRGKGLLILGAALFAVALVLWAVTVGFRGHQFRRDAGALTRPYETTPTQPVR